MIALYALLAHGGPDPSGEIVRPLGSFGEVNWTTMVVTASGDAQRRTTESLDAVEAAAERAASSALRLAVNDVRVQRGTTVNDLLEDAELSEQVATRMVKRTISKVTYGDRDDVTLELTLLLSDLLKPWAWQRVDTPRGSEEGAMSTGLVIDARGKRVDPSWAPRIITSDGEVFYEGQLSAKTIRRVAPAVYVPHGAAPAAQRAGDAPLFVDAARVKGSDFYLSEQDSRLITETPHLYDRMLDGHLVVVMDP